MFVACLLFLLLLYLWGQIGQIQTFYQKLFLLSIFENGGTREVWWYWRWIWLLFRFFVLWNLCILHLLKRIVQNLICVHACICIKVWIWICICLVLSLAWLLASLHQIGKRFLFLHSQPLTYSILSIWNPWSQAWRPGSILVILPIVNAFFWKYIVLLQNRFRLVILIRLILLNLVSWLIWLFWHIILAIWLRCYILVLYSEVVLLKIGWWILLYLISKEIICPSILGTETRLDILVKFLMSTILNGLLWSIQIWLNIL